MFRITLQQNLENRPAAAFQAVYDFPAGQQIWAVVPVGPAQDRAVIVVNSAVDLVNQPGVTSRSLRAHYPAAPNQIDYAISSVQA